MIRINLLGHDTAKPKRSKKPEFSVGGSENTSFILAIIATIVVIGAAWWWQSRTLASLRERHAVVTAEAEQLAATAARVAELEDRRAVVGQKLGVIVELKKNQSGPVLLLDQVSRQLSDSVWLTDMTLRDGNVSIAGQALSEIAISDFENNLRLSSFFADTNIDFTQDTADNTVQFQMSTRFVPLSAPPEPAPGTEPAAAGR